jgi:hypothetical protein
VAEETADSDRAGGEADLVNRVLPDRHYIAPKPQRGFQAWVAAGPRDYVDVVFYNRRFDPANRLADTTVARSTDGGRTFRNVKVSTLAKACSIEWPKGACATGITPNYARPSG